MNKDCLLKIASKLNFHDIYNLSLTCKEFKKNIYDNHIFWKSMLDWKYDSPKFYFYISYFKQTPELGFKRAVKTNNLEIVKYFCKTYSFTNYIYYNMAKEASEYGHLDILIYLENYITKLPYVLISCMDRAINNNRINIINYLINRVHISDEMIIFCAKTGHIKVMEILLHNYECFFGWNSTIYYAMVEAKRHGKKEMARYLRRRDLFYVFFMILTIIMLFITRK